MTNQAKTIAGTASLGLAATGVVFGDIGTSPLYALKETLHVSGASPDAVLGVISLIFWALMIVVTVKYLLFVMRADNHGEGGILALLALLPAKVRTATGGAKLLLLIVILTGTALLLGDGALTPAISVLSATEGLAIVNEDLASFAVPATVVILLLLFLVQSRGTHSIGRVFGPVMLLWFVTIGGLGAWHVVLEPTVLRGLAPTYGISFLAAHPGSGLAIGAVVILAVTGAEALYADMGHFGIRPIRWAWALVVAPALVLAYLGMAAKVLADPGAAANPFFALAPNPTFTLVLVILSTAATVIASQALITGVFSLMRQAVQLGLLPRLSIRHTNHQHEGQIYVPLANFLLAVTSIGLVVAFGSSSDLASAYVLAIAGTMGITTIAFYCVTRDVWGWSRARAIPVFVVFLIVDCAFVASTFTKLFTGGWVPVVLAVLVLALMLVWRRGQRLVAQRAAAAAMTWSQVQGRLDGGEVPRTPGEAVFLSSDPEQVPQALTSSIALIHALPAQIMVLTIVTQPVPTVPDDERLTITRLSEDVQRVIAKVGFAESPSIPELLSQVPGDPASRIYYLSDRTFMAMSDGEMGTLSESVYAFLHRNSTRPARYFDLPDDRVVVLSTHMDL